MYVYLVSQGCLSGFEVGLTELAVIWLFVGRFFQCITSNGLWIVGLSTMAENLGSEHMGKISGLTTTLTAAGTTAGPIIAGILFAMGGYWCAWTGAAAFLLVDIMMRVLMTEKHFESQQGTENNEQDPLLMSHPPRVDGEQSDGSPSSEVRGWRFHLCLFREAGFSTGIFCAFVFALLVGCFESTLAVHVRITFGWEALYVGFLLALFQGPGMILAAPVGWMKDRIGSRIPTAVALVTLSPLVILLGVPGSKLYPFEDIEALGMNLYVVCVASIGCLLSLLNGIGSMQATGK